MFAQASTLAFTDIKVAWGSDFGNEGSATSRRKKLRDPICDAYNSQFQKVEETIANSALPAPPDVYPYREATTSHADPLDKFVDEAMEEAEAPPTAQAPAPPPTTYAPKPERSLRTQLLELLLFTVSGGILMVVLDIAVRLGMLLERRGVQLRA